MGAGKGLATWGKRGKFSYQGDPRLGTKVSFGHGRSFVVTAAQWDELLAHFGGQRVPIGNSRNPKRGSLGSWLRAHVGVPLAAAYVGPILVREGLATRDGDELVFA